MNSSDTMAMHHNMKHSTTDSEHPYQKFFFISVIHFLIMYAVMFTMVDQASSIFLNFNNLYMTGMMLAPMVFLMPLTMGMMYPNKRLNLLIYVSAFILFIAFYIFMRSQTFIDDKEFVRSMIPHHSGAILMCNEAKITDAELKNLCTQIKQGQLSEIEQMKRILIRL